MAQVETIYFDSSKKARAALVEYYGRPGILEIELLDANKTLRLTTEDDWNAEESEVEATVDAALDAAEALEPASPAPATPEEPSAVQEAVQVESEVAHGTVADDPAVQESTLAQNVVPDPISQEKSTAPETTSDLPAEQTVTHPGAGNEALVDPGDDEDLLGEAPAAEQKPVVDNNTSRDTLREINEKYNLGVNIPTAGPLQPVRDRIAAALADKE